LINFGILPLTLVHEEDYDKLTQGEHITIPALSSIRSSETLQFFLTDGSTVPVHHGLSGRQIDIVLAGGLLNYMRG
ncbi:MAG: aconitate hydratase, partial [bacterium]